MLLQDFIDTINKIETECEKEISVIKFSDLTPYEITAIEFVPDYCYSNDNDDDIKPGGTD